MGVRTIILFLCVVVLSSAAARSDGPSELEEIAEKVRNPEKFLQDSLVVLGNASLSSAEVVFLPEVHDDPESLTHQLLLIAREKKAGRPFIVLDESLASMKKSVWDVFSQKALEILAAQEQRQDNASYAPHRFEGILQKLANKYRKMPGQLEFLPTPKIWTLAGFFDHATPFFGWDKEKSSNMVERNITMVESIRSALKSNNRVLVMLGARHVPELEFLTSRKLLCGDSNFDDMHLYFDAMAKKFGSTPRLKSGAGATTPIYQFITKLRYAVVFDRRLYKEIADVVEHFGRQGGPGACISLAQ